MEEQGQDDGREDIILRKESRGEAKVPQIQKQFHGLLPEDLLFALRATMQ